MSALVADVQPGGQQVQPGGQQVQAGVQPQQIVVPDQPVQQHRLYLASRPEAQDRIPYGEFEQVICERKDELREDEGEGQHLGNGQYDGPDTDTESESGLNFDSEYSDCEYSDCEERDSKRRRTQDGSESD